ncbi:Tll0287-like domain-containing protein [Salinimicrobium soli]|uniref:Tll0287-like domain-containing protein n=1 Tax=Salinimicrobium soli TaxID=1254399 RepID=UPI003AB01916
MRFWSLLIFPLVILGCKEPKQSSDAIAESNFEIQQSYEQRGIEIAMEAQTELGQHLMQELNKGTLHALQYCNENALPLTQAIAKKNSATVQRVSDKFRNPNNKANKDEKKLINQYRKDLSWGNDPQPVLFNEGDSIRFYYPLVTNNLCLQCHGRIQDTERSVREKILYLYPDDKAMGYAENEVRGLWKIGFKK